VAGLAAEARFELSSPDIVMAGLDPAIHDFLRKKQDVDARHRRQVYAVCAKQTAMAGHDGQKNERPGAIPAFFLCNGGFAWHHGDHDTGASPCA
jgi:hypothetical protein